MKKWTALLIYSLTLAFGVLQTQADELIAQWRFDDGVGTTVTDSSNNGNDGFMQGSIWKQGVVNSCAQLGWQGGVNCGNDPSLNTEGPLSIQAWIRPWDPQYAQSPIIVSKEGSYILGLSPNKSLTLTLWLNGEKQSFESDHKEWKNGIWKHVAAVFTGTEVQLYVNGGLDKVFPVASGQKIDASSSFCFIAAINKKNYFSGTVDEISLHGEALSSQAIAMAHNEGEYQMARRENRFTDFYEKLHKRSGDSLVPGALWIDTEDFDNYGGWWMDTQFVPQMGSPYLIAAGLGTPVEDATTNVEIKEAGTYRLWVRNKNWIAEKTYDPGKFKVSVGGKESETIFGTVPQRAWVWQNGGDFKLEAGQTSIALKDITGYYGRCDAIILTQDLEYVPKQEQKDYRAQRDRFVGTIPVKEMGHFDFIVVGGGAAGCNAAIAAARGGAKVALIQDRPMVGGNNSAEMGVPLSGGSSFFKGREAGLNEEIGRIHAFNYLSKWASAADLVLANEPNISLFLNSHVFEAEMGENKQIKAVKAFNMIDGHQTRYTGDMFADCTGDGWLGYYAGAEIMLGRESKEKWGEKNGSEIADNVTMSGSLMQNSILGYQAIDMGKPTPFDAPDWVYYLTNDEGLHSRPSNVGRHKSGTWWHENQGRIDDLWDPEHARDDLIRCSMSYYAWLKNRSKFAEDAINYKLKYIPLTNAKRETRRIVGDVIVKEQDLLERTIYPDRVGYFTWKLDIHHPDGIFSNESPYDFEDNISPGSIPLRCLYSKDVPNMFMAGRNVSVSHIALGSARVQQTTAMMGQAIGTAAAFCKKYETNPRGIYESHIAELQQQLMKDDVTILHLGNEDENDLVRNAKITVSSSKSKAEGPQNINNGLTRPMDDDMEMWIDKVPHNMWVSDPAQELPQWVEIDLGKKKEVNSVYLTWDTNLASKRYADWEFKDSERMPPECARDYEVQVKTQSGWETVAVAENNYQRRRIHRFPEVEASDIKVVVNATNGDPSARIYEIRAYNE